MKCPNWFNEKQCTEYRTGYLTMSSYLKGGQIASLIIPKESHLAMAWSLGVADAAKDIAADDNDENGNMENDNGKS